MRCWILLGVSACFLLWVVVASPLGAPACAPYHRSMDKATERIANRLEPTRGGRSSEVRNQPEKISVTLSRKNWVDVTAYPEHMRSHIERTQAVKRRIAYGSAVFAGIVIAISLACVVKDRRHKRDRETGRLHPESSPVSL